MNTNLKRKRKRKIFFITIILMFVAFVVVAELKYSSFEEGVDSLKKGKSVESLTVDSSTLYLHIKIEAPSVEYKIISPDNEVVKEGIINKDVEYYGRGIKGKWKLELNTNTAKSIEYHIWTGNLKRYDQIK